jgi:hypothetical protein
MFVRNLHASSYARIRPFTGDHGRMVIDDLEFDGGVVSRNV